MSFSLPLLFAGSYAPAAEPGLYAFKFNPATGALAGRAAFAGIANPSFLVVHPNRRWLYAVSETSAGHDGELGSVWALRFDYEPGTVQAVNRQPSGGDWPCHLQLDATGTWLLVSNYGSGAVGVLPIRTDGSLGEMTDRVLHEGTGPNLQRQEGPHTHSATFAPDNRFALVADLGIDQVVVYGFDANLGRLIAHGQVHARPGAGPRHMVFHPDGHLLYVANELDSTVAVYGYDPAGAFLREVQTVDTLPPGTPENLVADIHFAASARRLYVSNRGHDSIAVFAVEADGKLDRRTIAPCGGQWPRNFAIAPGGQFLLVANQNSSEISVLPARPGAEELGLTCTRAPVGHASCVQFMPGEGTE